MRAFFASWENRLATALAFLLGSTTLFFVAPHSKSLTLFNLHLDNTVFYEAFVILAILSLGNVAYFARGWEWKLALTKLLLIGLPAALMMVYGFMESNNFHYLFWIALGGYVIATGILLCALYIDHAHAKQIQDPTSLSGTQWWQAQSLPILCLVTLLTSLFFCFGLSQLTHYAAVDEALWYEGRIAKYWNNIEQRDWKGTRISDKPGITVALATGPGLFFYNPKHFDDIKYLGEPLGTSKLERFYFAFRFPLLLVITLLLPLFYFFLERLLGRQAALFSYTFLALSPVLIGMSKIVNPDALLWLFAPLSLLAYLTFLTRGTYRYLIFSGILLGLALLTKYVANILFIFFLGLIFLEYLYHQKPTPLLFGSSLKKSLGDLGVLTFTALTTFYLLFPAVWIKPERLLTSTVFSQAFTKVAPLFFVLMSFILLDQWLGKARLTEALLNGLMRIKRTLAALVATVFLAASLFVVATTWSSAPLYHFSELLASPKTIASRSDFLGVFLTNFYPLLFGIAPLLCILLFLAPLNFFRKQFFQSVALRTSFYLFIFILLYYLGTTVNNVAAIVRYQIVLFPLAAIIAGITVEQGWLWLEKRSTLQSPRVGTPLFIAGVLILFGLLSLWRHPFPLSYANLFLPRTAHIDVKDMGAGSFEAAMYLNSLPNATNMLIWTDKDGVCKFFVGACKSSRHYSELREEGLDYIVVSAGRKNRTTKMMAGDIITQKPGLIRFDQYYDREESVFRTNINDRPTQYVKVFPFTP